MHECNASSGCQPVNDMKALTNQLEKVNKKIKKNNKYLNRAIKVAAVTFPLMPFSFIPMAIVYGLDQKSSKLLNAKRQLEENINTLKHPVVNIPSQSRV